MEIKLPLKYILYYYICKTRVYTFTSSFSESKFCWMDQILTFKYQSSFSQIYKTHLISEEWKKTIVSKAKKQKTK